MLRLISASAIVRSVTSSTAGSAVADRQDLTCRMRVSAPEPTLMSPSDRDLPSARASLMAFGSSLRAIAGAAASIERPSAWSREHPSIRSTAPFHTVTFPF